jgi:hypothetical protein
MADALNDRSIRIDPIPYDSSVMDEEDASGLSYEDIEAVMSHLRESS